jgi:hypothetical protein
MTIHKTQSNQGPLDIQFSVASVSYNLYNKIKNKYYDPVNDNSKFNIELNRKISSTYYSGFAELLKEKNDLPTLNFSDKNREFTLMPIYSPYDDYLFHDRKFRYRPYRYGTLFLVLDKRIKQFAKEGFLENEEKNEIAEDGLYIDNDGIGLMIDF